MTEMEGYERLGAAIVTQACRDVTSHPGDVRRFFCDKRSIFDLCMPTVDGKAIYKNLMENYRKVSKCTESNET